MMKAKWNMKNLVIAALLTLGVPLTSSLAGIISSSSAVGSSSGFGTINYTTGSNVNEFILYGRNSSGASYLTSTGTSYIAQGVAGDGTTVNNNSYDATSYTWKGGTPTLNGSFNIESCQPITDPNGWGVTPFTYASISLTSPTNNFEFSFFVHDYYASANLEVLQNGSVISIYSNVMSSSYLPGGEGEARNTDYFYDFNFAGVTPGDTLEFRFNTIENLGSSWANIGFLSASLNYAAPESISSQLITMTAIPEPTTAAAAVALGALLCAGRRIRKTTGRWHL